MSWNCPYSQNVFIAEYNYFHISHQLPAEQPFIYWDHYASAGMKAVELP